VAPHLFPLGLVNFRCVFSCKSGKKFLWTIFGLHQLFTAGGDCATGEDESMPGLDGGVADLANPPGQGRVTAKDENPPQPPFF